MLLEISSKGDNERMDDKETSLCHFLADIPHTFYQLYDLLSKFRCKILGTFEKQDLNKAAKEVLETLSLISRKHLDL
jgi:hypothetical protein